MVLSVEDHQPVENTLNMNEIQQIVQHVIGRLYKYLFWAMLCHNGQFMVLYASVSASTLTTTSCHLDPLVDILA